MSFGGDAEHGDSAALAFCETRFLVDLFLDPLSWIASVTLTKEFGNRTYDFEEDVNVEKCKIIKNNQK